LAVKTTTVAQAKARLSELIGQVAHAGQSVLITRRGRPMAKLVPVDAPARRHPAKVKGWLDKDDPFFDELDGIVAERGRRKSRAVDL
jgi:prevent-host-death family protein